MLEKKDEDVVMHTKKFTFKDVKNVFSSLLIAPPPTATRVSGFLAKNKKHGWTLAETLITLTIIGVIAAMTVPNLISNFRKAQAETGLRVMYNTLSTAIKLAEAKEGSITRMINACIGPVENSNDKFTQQANCFANNYLKPYLKYTKSCDYRDTNCIKKLYSVGLYKNLDGGYTNMAYMDSQYHSSLKLNNGMLVGVIWWDNRLPRFLVDINGTAGPNKTGVDSFHFELSEQKHLDCFPWGNPKEKWCNEDNRIGHACACLIMQNGWKIPDDYPIKKF